MLVTLCSLHTTNKLTIVGNSRSFKKVDFRTFKGRDLAHGELGIESFITVLLEIEGLDINRDTTVGSLEGGILAILFLKVSNATRLTAILALATRGFSG